MQNVLVVAVVGLCFGSFVNALVWRLHEQAKPKRKRAAKDNELSISTGRSMCPHCKHTLSAADLVPLFSWVALRGKCRYCHVPISVQYPLVELFSAILFIVSYAYWPWPFDITGVLLLVGWFVSLIILIALIIYDIRWMLLPNRLVFPLIGVSGAMAVIIIVTSDDIFKSCIMLLSSVGIASGLFYVLYQISRGKWIGGGDVKLGLALGLLLGRPSVAALMLFGACLLGTLYSLPLMLTGKLKRDARVPFGPFLIVATIIAMLFGESIIQWYAEHMLGLV